MRTKLADDSSSERKGVDLTSLLAMAGLAVFTFVVVTTRLDVGEAAIIVALTGLIMRPAEFRFPAPCWWALGFIAWAVATAPFAMSPDIALSTSIERVKVFVVFLVVANTLSTGRRVRLYVLFIVVCFVLFPARGALMNYLGGYTVFGRALWNRIYANPNDLAAMALLALGLALSVLSAKRENKLIRWGAGTGAVIFLLVILLTQSRGVFLGLVISMGPLLVGSAWKRPAVLVAAIALMVMGTVLLPDTVWKRFSGIDKLTSTSTISQADPEGSAAQRWEITKTAFKIFQDHPIVGVGLGNYPAANALYAPALKARDTHNTYLNIATELGLPGLLLWLAIILSVFRRWRRARAPNYAGNLPLQPALIARAIIGFLVAGFFGSYSGITMLYLLLGILWCAANVTMSGTGPRPLTDAPIRETH